MLQNLPADDWIASPTLDSAFDAMAEASLSLDALVYPRHLSALETFCVRRPEIPVIIDHGAKPPIVSGRFQAWADRIAALAAIPQVSCKLSGLTTEAAPEQGRADLAPYVEHLVRCFGPERLMWGSDWPVVTLRSSYLEWLDMALSLTRLRGSALDAVRFRTAQRVYRL